MFIKRYLNWFFQQRGGGDGGKTSVAGGFRGLIVNLGAKLPIQAVSASREGWPR